MCLSLLGIGSCALLVIGVVDAARAEGLAARATGAALSVVAALALTATIMAREPTERGRLAAAVAAIAHLLVSASAIAATRPWDETHLALVGAAGAVLFAVAGAALAKARVEGVKAEDLERQDSRPKPPQSSPEAVQSGDTSDGVLGPADMLGASATILAALVALPLTWYSAHYLPTHTAAAVSITSEIEAIGDHEGHGTARIAVRLRNTSRADVRILGSMYVLGGTSVQFRASKDSRKALLAEEVEPVLTRNYGPAARYSASSTNNGVDLVQFGQAVLDQARLAPDESTETKIVAFFDKGRGFDVLTLSVDVALARADRLAVDASDAPGGHEYLPAEPCGEGKRVVRGVWEVVPRSLVESLTSGRKEVVVGRVLQDDRQEDPAADMWWPSVPYLVYELQGRGRHCSHLFDFDSDEGLEKASQAGLAGAWTERLVPTPTTSPSGTVPP